MRKCVISIFLLMVSSVCFARTAEPTRSPRKLSKLPGAYSNFSEADVLGTIFDGFDPATKTVSGIPDSENEPTKVSILEAKPWHAGDEWYLVVLTSLGDTAMLCGSCSLYTPLAVLKKDGNRLARIARQDLPAHSSFEEDEKLSETFGALSYSGHQSIALDLAPYKVTDEETLIGVRIQHMWLAAPFYQTRFFLFRVDQGRLRKVLEIPVIDREYPNAHKDGPQIMLKTVSTLSTVPSGGKFRNLVVRKTTIRCMESDDGDCDSKSGPAKAIKTWIEEWRFDGLKFNLVPHPAARPVLPKNNPA